MTLLEPDINPNTNIESGRITELDIEFRQNSVNTAVYELLHQTTPIINWDDEIIDDVRDAVARVLEYHGIMFADEYYPSFDDNTDNTENELERPEDIETIGGFCALALETFGALTIEQKCLAVFAFIVLMFALPLLIF